MGFFSNIKKMWGVRSKDLPNQAVNNDLEQNQLSSNKENLVDENVLGQDALANEAGQGADQDALANEAGQGADQVALANEAGQGADQVALANEAGQGADQVAAKNVDQGVVLAVDSPWKQELTVALRSAEPKLSAWLSHVLIGVESANPELWERLEFFLAALELPSDEINKFISSFKDWLDEMGYEQVSDFKSELQYRLALSLDLEDEEDERSRLILKLSEGLEKTREQLTRHLDSLIKGHKSFDAAFWADFEEILIMADVGHEPASELIDRLKKRIAKAGLVDPELFRPLLAEELALIFENKRRISVVNFPEVVLMIGVNGVGKTTTIAKLAHRAQMQGRKVLIAAGDTFRAAAIEQLEIWAKRVGAGFFAKKSGSDPAAVAYEALDKAINEGYDLLFIDTAGRLQTKVNLMEELQKIFKVLEKKHPGAPHRSILVIDATTGQNALSQAKLFKEACGIDEIVLTKLDGTAKGGVAVAVVMQHDIPITFIGLGEKMDDLRPFDGAEFAKALLGL